MNLELSLVPIGHVSKALPNLLGYFAESEKRSGGRSSIDDLLRFILTEKMQLWVVFSPEEQNVYGHVITEVKQYPQYKMLVIQYCCIEPHHMQYVEDKMQSVAESFAKDMGCKGVEFVGRPGWDKKLDKYGYSAKSVIYERFFKE